MKNYKKKDGGTVGSKNKMNLPQMKTGGMVNPNAKVMEDICTKAYSEHSKSKKIMKGY